MNDLIHIKDFFSKEECINMINLHKINFDKTINYRGTNLLIIDNLDPHLLKLNKFLKKRKNIELNYGQIVQWPNGTFQPTHKDGTEKPENEAVCICYLNDNYVGGRTKINDKYIEAKTGDFIFFEGKKIPHSVEKVGGKRYTLISWYRYV
jgi:hypothetical protein